MGVNKRIRDLEDRVLGTPKLGTTQFCPWALPENEQILLENARKIAEMELSYEETTPAQRTILEEAHKLLRFRIFDLFTNYLEDLLCHGDKVAIVVLHERFLWFIRELAKEIDQQLEVSEIERNALENSEVDLVDEYFRKAPELYTKESYDEVSTELFLDLLKERPNFLEDLKSRLEMPEGEKP